MEQRPYQVKMAMRAWLRHLGGDRRAATAVEYGLILALIVLTMVGALVGVANESTRIWDNINTKVETAR